MIAVGTQPPLEELELLDEEELLLEDELDEPVEPVVELEEELLDEVESLEPTQLGAIKLPSWLPWTPKTLLAVAPGAGNCQEQQWVNWKLVPGLTPARDATFH